MSAYAIPPVHAPEEIRSLREPWSLGDFFILAAPALQFLQVQSFGLLFGTDLALLAALPFLLARGGRRLAQRHVLFILLLGLFWLGGQVATDLYRETPAADYLRGWSKIALTLTHFAAIVILMRNSLRRFFLYGIGLCVGQVLSCLISPSEYLKDSLWKNGYGTPITLGAMLLGAWLLRRRRGSPWLLALALMLAAVNLLGDFRSVGVICAVAGLYAFFMGRPVSRRFRSLRFALAIATIVLAVMAFKSTYEYAASSGWERRDAIAWKSRKARRACYWAAAARFWLRRRPFWIHRCWAMAPGPKTRSTLRSWLSAASNWATRMTRMSRKI